MTRDYHEFLEAKCVSAKPCGFEPAAMNPALYPFQRDIVRWACRKGRAAVFADCGLGKTLMQLEWARQVCDNIGGDGTIMILAPLAVSQQTRREGKRFGYDVNIVRDGSEVKPGINIANYEILHRFEGVRFDGVVLDESSILKNYAGSTRNAIIERFEETQYRLACTATPSPNDYMELGNHAEFLGVMTRTEMLAMFFIHDGGETSKWRLKGHAHEKFWDWCSTWACVVSSPADLGYPADGFDLPELVSHVHFVEAPQSDEMRLFDVAETGLREQQDARRSSVEVRGDFIAQMVNSSDEQWLIWCDLNSESQHVADSIPDAVEVRGSDSDEHREDAMLGFADGKYRVLVTKPSIAGFGMNWQNCHNVAFCGLSHSYEQFYQAVRRCWRYGQTEKVNVHIVTTDRESAVVQNVMRKAADNEEMREMMGARTMAIRNDEEMTKRDISVYNEDSAKGRSWTMLLGDCCERLREMDDETVGFSVFSPPFASLYTYSNSERDMGNCNDAEFIEHIGFLADELYRVMMPGRIMAFHCTNIPALKERDGYIGIKDFRGDLIRVFQQAGFIYHSEVTIWKDPVTAMQRTKAIGLLNKQKNKDSTISRQGIPDYLVVMRKPGTNQEPVTHTNDEFPISVWQRYASPVWMDINPSNTLQYMAAREGSDERHICPLQLEVIERAVRLWSNPGDVVLSPFAGIGSEGYVSVKCGRRFIGIELKQSYYILACANLEQAEREADELTLFDFRRVS